MSEPIKAAPDWEIRLRDELWYRGSWAAQCQDAAIASVLIADLAELSTLRARNAELERENGELKSALRETTTLLVWHTRDKSDEEIEAVAVQARAALSRSSSPPAARPVDTGKGYGE